MTVLGIVSDTHLPRFGRALPRALVAGLRDARVEQILHCGDFTDPLAADLFAALAPFDAVAGNNDGDEIRTRFGRRKILAVEDVRIGVVHGDIGPGSARDNARRAFAEGDEHVDLVCFGHSHQPFNARIDGRRFVNPGSPTDKRREARYSYAIVRIDGSAIEAQIRYFDDRSI